MLQIKSGCGWSKLVQNLSCAAMVGVQSQVRGYNMLQKKHCVSYLLLHSGLPQNLVSYNKQLSATVSVGKEFRINLAGWFCFRVSNELVVKTSATETKA